MDSKQCIKCSKVKPFGEFHKRTRSKDGYRNDCKVCVRARWRAHHSSAAIKSQDWARHLRRRHNMSVAAYNALHEQQRGGCAICNMPESEYWRGTLRKLAVDHNHTTGENRRLLCGRCNKMIGLAREDPEILRAGAAYLELFL